MTDHWTIDYRPGGWARARSDGLTAYLHLGTEDGGGRPRLRIYMAALTADRPVTDAVWRSVPLAEIEMHLALFSGVSSPEIDHTMDALTQPMEIAGFSIHSLERYFKETEPLPIQGNIPGRTLVGGVPVAATVQLDRPVGGALTDDFLRKVAGLYLATIEAKGAPAPAIAGASGASIRTVHGWVAEARRRGILPPATKGKAG